MQNERPSTGSSDAFIPIHNRRNRLKRMGRPVRFVKSQSSPGSLSRAKPIANDVTAPAIDRIVYASSRTTSVHSKYVSIIAPEERENERSGQEKPKTVYVMPREADRELPDFFEWTLRNDKK